MSTRVGERIEYQNEMLHCEGYHCMMMVRRVYQPFCDSCFRNRRNNKFLSRDGKEYQYDGRRWFRVEE